MVAAFSALAIASCVDVPAGVRAEFAGPGPDDRSNYRPGKHGAEPPVVKAAAPAEDDAGAATDPDAGAPAAEPSPAPADEGDAGVLPMDGGEA